MVGGGGGGVQLAHAQALCLCLRQPLGLRRRRLPSLRFLRLLLRLRLGLLRRLPLLQAPLLLPLPPLQQLPLQLLLEGQRLLLHGVGLAGLGAKQEPGTFSARHRRARRRRGSHVVSGLAQQDRRRGLLLRGCQQAGLRELQVGRAALLLLVPPPLLLRLLLLLLW